MAALEDRLNSVTAKFGIWQFGVFLLVALVKIPSAWHMLGVLFKAPDAEFWCEQPKTLAHLPTDVWINISHPIKEEKNGKKYYNPCEIYDIGFEGLVEDDKYHKYSVVDYVKNISYSASLRPCQEFRYDNNSVFHETVVTEWHLVCNRRILVNVSQFFYLFGVLTGGFFATMLLPRVGPRSILMFGAIVQIITGTATAFVPLLEMNITLRFTAACGCALMFTAGYVICRDITWGQARILTCAFYEWFWSFGVMSLPGLTLLFGTTSWRVLQVAISVPTAAILVIAFFFLPESPRWLMENGQFEEAEEILRKIAEVNRQPLPPEESFHNHKSHVSHVRRDSKKRGKTSKWLIWFGLFKGQGFCKMIALHLLWATTIVTYYGALLNVKNLGSNLFLNIVIAGLAEIVGVILGALLILFAGKHKWHYLGIILLTGGISCIFSWTLFLDTVEGKLQPIGFNWWHQWALLALAMIGRIAVACSLTLLQVSSAEIVSTTSPDHQKMTSLSSVTFARICLLSAPFIGYLAIYGKQISLTAFGSLTMLGGFCSLVLAVPKEMSLCFPGNSQLDKTWTFKGRQSIWTINQESRMAERTESFNQSFTVE
ncbi:organic cation transporter-like protein [Hetaerina americana]|uniref:organic cation transporter-like protein n=1 Tax=Hetaerina americana TaxID=62018 RepID=UPI003A7F2958